MSEYICKENCLHIKRFNDVESSSWNSLVKSLPEGTIFQTTFWGNYFKEQFGAKPFYLYVEDKDSTPLGILLLFKTSRLPTGLINRTITALFPQFSWIGGPLIFDKSRQNLILSVILDEVDKIVLRENGYVIGEISPSIYGNASPNNFKKIFECKSYQNKKNATFLVDLTQTKDILWNNIDKNARKNVNRSEKQGVTVNRIKTKKELDSYIDLLHETRKRMGLNLPPAFPNQIMWRHLRENGYLEVFMAKQGDNNLAGLGVLLYNGILTEIAVAQSNYCLDNKIYANDQIKWEIIKWGHETGCRIYDLAGVSPEPKTQKEEGIFKFKAKWGGNLRTSYNYYKIVGKNRDILIQIIKKWGGSIRHETRD